MPVTSIPLPNTNNYIIGSDEVGCGALAGPLCVCAVAVPTGWSPPNGLTDSKLMRPAARRRIYTEHLQYLHMAVVSVPNELLDELGMTASLSKAHARAIRELLPRFHVVDIIVDGAVHPDLPNARCVPHADALFPVVSAASVIAKVNRDWLMEQFHQEFPHYGFAQNSGYGSPRHFEGLAAHGVCRLHRRSFAPIHRLLHPEQAAA